MNPTSVWASPQQHLYLVHRDASQITKAYLSGRGSSMGSTKSSAKPPVQSDNVNSSRCLGKTEKIPVVLQEVLQFRAV